VRSLLGIQAIGIRHELTSIVIRTVFGFLSKALAAVDNEDNSSFVSAKSNPSRLAQISQDMQSYIVSRPFGDG